jgi:predicted dehydrogenase
MEIAVRLVYQAAIIGTGGVAGMGLFGVHDDDELGEKSVPASHAGGYATVDDVEITAIADIDEEKLERFGNAWRPTSSISCPSVRRPYSTMNTWWMPRPRGIQT